MSPRSSSWFGSRREVRIKSGGLAALLAGCVLSSACREQSVSAPAPTSIQPPGTASAPLAIPESTVANPCQQRVATWQAAQSSITGASVAERLAQIREAAAKVGEDPEGCTSELIDSAAADELRKVVVLETAGTAFPAAIIYSCSALSEGTQCAGRTADDTALLGEVAEDAPAIPATTQAKVALLADYPVASLQWYAALDDEPAKTLTPAASGVLTLPKAEDSNLLFAIGRGPSGEFHKWVWLLR